MDNKTLITGGTKKQKWLNFMTNMPKGYVTKEEMAAKRKQLNATDLGASHPIGNRNEKVNRSFPLGNRREKIKGQLM